MSNEYKSVFGFTTIDADEMAHLAHMYGFEVRKVNPGEGGVKFEMPHISSQVFEFFLKALPTEPSDEIEYWTTGDMIMCASEISCNALTDVFDFLDGDVCTGYYDPVEDERSGEVDKCTGYWYVDMS